MNSKTTIIGLVAAVAVLSGAMGLSVTGAFSDQTLAQTTIPATGFLMGQLEIEAHNQDGELIAYRVSDNEVVDDGEQCILKMLFGTTGESRAKDETAGVFSATVARGGYFSDLTVDTTTTNDANCTGILTGAWDVLGVGIGTTTYDNNVTHDLLVVMEDECAIPTKVATSCTSNGLDRGYATTKTWTNGTGNTDTTIVLKKTFTTDGVAANITEAALFNSTVVAGSGMLAHQTFTAVALGTADSITVQWTFTVGD